MRLVTHLVHEELTFVLAGSRESLQIRVLLRTVWKTGTSEDRTTPRHHHLLILTTVTAVTSTASQTPQLSMLG